MSDFEPGTIIDGRYRLISRLGAGGMADVYLAKDEQLDREVAVKLLQRRFAQDAAFVERFRREAQAAASLQHPNVVSVFDRGAYDGTYYIAMEYLQGRTLKRVIREEAPLEVGRAIDLTVQILKAAQFAHRRGVIHRDLKPHNVIIDDNDHVKVTDFGIARAGASDMTETGSIMGTAQYLSPEQAQGHSVSAPSDLYSVGIVLYEMLTGRVPFDGESPVAIALKQVSEAPVPPREINPAIPKSLDQVVMWSLNKNPGDRPDDADQFIRALEHVRDTLPAQPGESTASMTAVHTVDVVPVVGYPETSALPVQATAGSSEPGDQLDRYGEEDVPRPQRRAVWPWILAAVLVLLLAGGGLAAYLTSRPKPVVMPSLVNLRVDVAQRDLGRLGLNSLTDYVNSAKPAQTVITQSVKPGTKLHGGATITLTISSGPAQVSIPNVQGESRKAAVKLLRQSGLKVSHVYQEASATVTAGNATRTEPNAGNNVSSGTAVVLYISSGLAVPGVVGDTVAQAQDALSQFTVRTVTQTSTTQTPGTVVGQTPAANHAAGSNNAVTLTVAQAPTTASVPNILGATPGSATSTLNDAGLNVVQVDKPVSNLADVGIVVSQRPAGGATVKKQSTVRITVGIQAPITTKTLTSPIITRTTPGTTVTSTNPTASSSVTTGLASGRP
ncbi:MAG: Stk1 family PASTA domain-containing Ser/Thr kinase [Solirubrobacteraceae bacterium]